MRSTPLLLPSVELLGPDVRASDLVFGIAVAVAVVVGGTLGVATAAPRSSASDTASIVAANEVVVAVRPVAKAPADASGETPGATAGPRDPATDVPSSTTPSLPPTSDDVSQDDVEPLGPGPAATAVAERPADAPAPTTDPLPPRPEGGIKSLPRLAPPTTPVHELGSDAPTEPGFGVGGPGIAPGTADPDDSPNDPYAYVDPALEQPGAAGGVGAGLVGGGGDEPTGDDADPLAARAVAAYRQRLQRWLSEQFVVTGTGLSAAQLAKLSVRARIKLDADRNVVDYALEGKAHPAFDAAARRVLEDVKGQQAPPLPAHYPGPLQSWIRVTFVCTEDRCD